MRGGRTQYTHATGLPALRERIAGWYAHALRPGHRRARIVVTAGASAALQLACLALFEAGDEVLMPDPSYPCNRHFVAAADGARPCCCRPRPEQRFQLDAAAVQRAWGPPRAACCWPRRPTPPAPRSRAAEMQRIVDAVRARGGVTLVDEIYLGLSYDDGLRPQRARQHGDDVISINSFSKYFSMTGWRLGWLVLPHALVAPVERLAQNLYICA